IRFPGASFGVPSAPAAATIDQVAMSEFVHGRIVPGGIAILVEYTATWWPPVNWYPCRLLTCTALSLLTPGQKHISLLLPGSRSRVGGAMIRMPFVGGAGSWKPGSRSSFG